MADIDLVKHDQGGVNARIIAREAKVDFRRVESASLKMKVSFCSAEGKRAFVRFFGSFQLSMHFISTIARTRLSQEVIGQVEALVRSRLDETAGALNKAIDDAEALFQAHGITTMATYDTVPMQLEVGVLSSSGRRFLDAITKLDQLMPLMQTLEIMEVVNAETIDRERALLKRRLRDGSNGARFLAARLRREMNVLEARRGAAIDDDAAGAGQAGDGPTTAALGEPQPEAGAGRVQAVDGEGRSRDAEHDGTSGASDCHLESTATADVGRSIDGDRPEHAA